MRIMLRTWIPLLCSGAAATKWLIHHHQPPPCCNAVSGKAVFRCDSISSTLDGGKTSCKKMVLTHCETVLSPPETSTFGPEENNGRWGVNKIWSGVQKGLDCRNRLTLYPSMKIPPKTSFQSFLKIFWFCIAWLKFNLSLAHSALQWEEPHRRFLAQSMFAHERLIFLLEICVPIWIFSHLSSYALCR